MNRLQLWLLRQLVKKAVVTNRHRLVTNMLAEEHRRHWTEDNFADIEAGLHAAVRTSMLKLKDEWLMEKRGN